jgi:hypothetical protein
MSLRRCLSLLVLCLPAACAHAASAFEASAAPAPAVVCGHQLFQRQQERNALLPKPRPLTRQQLLRSRRATTLSIAGTPTAPKPGDKAKFWGIDFTDYDGSDSSARRYRLTATLRQVTEHAYIYLEDDAPASARSIARLGQAFEAKIVPQLHKHFGTPWTPGIDSDPHVTLLVMDIRSPGGSSNPLGLGGVTIGGFFNDEDEYPNDEKHPYSNEREMVVLNANLDVGSQMVLDVLAHEYQHLIHWNQDRDEVLWVNEGLSMVAPAVAGFGSGMQSTLGNAVMAFGLDYDNSLTQWGERGQEAIVSDYGNVGLFFTYLGEKYGGPETFLKIAKQQENGIQGVLAGLKEAGYPIEFAQLFTRWAIANLADDPTLDEPPHYYAYDSPDLQNLRSSLEALNQLLPDLIPRLFEPVARVDTFPAKGGASLRPQAAHYIELTGTGTLNLMFDGGGHPFEAFVLAQNAEDDRFQLFPILLDSQSRRGSVPIPGLGQSVGRVYLVVTNVTDEGGAAAEYRYEATVE